LIKKTKEESSSSNLQQAEDLRKRKSEWKTFRKKEQKEKKFKIGE